MRCVLCLLILLAASADARYRRSEPRSQIRSSTNAHRANYCNTCERDSNGRIKRNSAARRAFRRDNPCPATGLTSGSCPGYVIDHVQALRHGGSDTPGNMAWQTVAEARAKDRVE